MWKDILKMVGVPYSVMPDCVKRHTENGGGTIYLRRGGGGGGVKLTCWFRGSLHSFGTLEGTLQPWAIVVTGQDL